MNLTFDRPVRATSLDSLPIIARRQARICWVAAGGRDGEDHTAGDMLAERDVRWFVVCDDRGTPVADLWLALGGALLFRAATTEIVGHALDDAFVCYDPALWSALAAAPDAPSDVDFAVGTAIARAGEEEEAPDTMRVVA
jgi:hypothetical protein